MDRNTVIGFVLIGLVLMIWLWMNAPPPQQQSLGKDSIVVVPNARSLDSLKPEFGLKKMDLISKDTLGKYFSHLANEGNKNLIVETNLYRAEIATKGGTIKSWELKHFKTWNKYPVNLVAASSGGDFNLLFYTSDGKIVNTKGLTFQSDFSNGQHINVAKGDSFKVALTLNIDNKSSIVKTLTFYDDLYSLGVTYKFEKMENIISNYEYQVTWESGLTYAEQNSINESNYANAAAYAGGELTEIDANKLNEPVKQNMSGDVKWVATRNKYFAVAIIPREESSQGAYLEGHRIKLPDEGVKENYTMALKMPFRGTSEEKGQFTVYLGPLDFDIIKTYHVELEKIMSLGAAWIIRPISEYVIIPLFKFLKLFIPNYGFVLIVFSLIVKIALYPLTKSSMKSMQKMQALQPMMNEIREKYKDDPQKMNQQVMRLYKEYGINPAGGCLPLLLQLPILYALWAVFSATIELRQATFIWWIHDLSIPDVVAKLPFRIPIFSINEISGLALLMGITMFVQQKMSVKDPRQKMMVWLMPLLMTLMFNSFPAGLNLYYFVFNLLSIGQQVWVNQKHKDEPLRKVEEKKNKGGIINKIAKDFPIKRNS